MEYCEQYCKYIQIKINNKQLEINKVEHKPDKYSIDELQQFNKLTTELANLTLDLQRCVDECKLRNRHRDVDDYSNDGKHVGVDPVILDQLKALEKEEEEEDEYRGGRTRSTFRRRNKSKTKRRQTRSTRRRNTRRRRSTRRNRKQ